jgi:hypothetical protein
VLFPFSLYPRPFNLSGSSTSAPGLEKIASPSRSDLLTKGSPSGGWTGNSASPIYGAGRTPRGSSRYPGYRLCQDTVGGGGPVRREHKGKCCPPLTSRQRSRCGLEDTDRCKTPVLLARPSDRSQDRSHVGPRGLPRLPASRTPETRPYQGKSTQVLSREGKLIRQVPV